MSKKCYMILEFYEDEISLEKKIQIAFYITLFASKCKIGVNLGKNITSYSWEYLKKINLNEMFAEITEDPEDFNIIGLFMGEGFSNYEQRMSNIQNFLQALYDLKEVKKITLDVDPYRTEEQTIEEEVPVINLHPKEFKEVMFKLHEENDHYTPLVRLIMDKRLYDKLFMVNELSQEIN